MSAVEFLMVLGVAGLFWFAWSSLKVRELANRVAREYCDSARVQFLDGSVGFGTLGLVREHGRLSIRRVYVFEYSESNVTRRQGAVVFVGGQFRNLLLLEP